MGWDFLTTMGIWRRFTIRFDTFGCVRVTDHGGEDDVWGFEDFRVRV